jgi:Flp pilus assembly protein TadD
VAKLKALGYLSSVTPAPKNATGTRTPQSFNNEGLILRETGGRDAAAERAFMQALMLDPNYASARQNLDDLLAKRGIEKLRVRDCKGAVADLRRVAQESALLWASIAAAEGCLGNDRAAEDAVRRSLALNPNQPELRRLVD